MNNKKKARIPTGLKARVIYFIALVLMALAYLAWRDESNKLEMIALDLGLIVAIIATIMYPLSCIE